MPKRRTKDENRFWLTDPRLKPAPVNTKDLNSQKMKSTVKSHVAEAVVVRDDTSGSASGSANSVAMSSGSGEARVARGRSVTESECPCEDSRTFGRSFSAVEVFDASGRSDPSEIVLEFVASRTPDYSGTADYSETADLSEASDASATTDLSGTLELPGASISIEEDDSSGSSGSGTSDPPAPRASVLSGWERLFATLRAQDEELRAEWRAANEQRQRQLDGIRHGLRQTVLDLLELMEEP